MNVRFLIKKPVRKNMECVLDRSILERVPVFLERFFFLKKVKLFFGTRSIPFFFTNIFHWVRRVVPGARTRHLKQVPGKIGDGNACDSCCCP